MSFEIYIKPDSFNQNAGIFEFRDNDYSTDGLIALSESSADGGIGWAIDMWGSVHVLTPFATLTLSDWTHLVLTFDESGVRIIYIDASFIGRCI